MKQNFNVSKSLGCRDESVIVLFVQPVGRYEAVEKVMAKVDADAMAWRRHLNFEGGSKIDTHGHYVAIGCRHIYAFRRRCIFHRKRRKEMRAWMKYFGKEAAAFIRRTVEGKRVRLDFDPANASRAHRDSTQQRRTSAYVFLEDGTLLNAEIIRHGYGFAYPRFPFAWTDV